MNTNLLLKMCLSAICLPMSVAAQVAKLDATVSADGSGAFTNLQQAIDAAPDNATNTYSILIKAGTYPGQIVIPKAKRHIRFVGENLDTTILTYPFNQQESNAATLPQFRGTGVIVLGNDFSAEQITFENTSGNHGQALALRVDGDREVFKHCRLLGWQDTVMLNTGRDYFTNCYVAGQVDFIYGSATVVFDHCEIHNKNGGHITAASTPKEHPFGFVFLNCKLTGDAEPWIDPRGVTLNKDRPGRHADLGRPWRPCASVTYLNCEMGPHITPEGWNNWHNPTNELTARFAEYNSTGPGANPGQRCRWSRQMSKEEADKITVATVLGGRDGWKPQAQP